MAEKATKPELEELIKFLTMNLVDQADDVHVSLVEERDADVYEIDVGDDDIGKIIGRGGKTARAIRSIVNAASPRQDRRIMVEILE